MTVLNFILEESFEISFWAMLNYIWIRNLIDVVRFSNLLKFHIGKKPRNPMFGIFFMRQRISQALQCGGGE